jgi:hypothetical protein
VDEERRKIREVRRMTDASMKALDMPGGEEILQQMLDKELSITEGITKLLLLSGDYVPREDAPPEQ